jgi:hypothetical protein
MRISPVQVAALLLSPILTSAYNIAYAKDCSEMMVKDRATIKTAQEVIARGLLDSVVLASIGNDLADQLRQNINIPL